VAVREEGSHQILGDITGVPTSFPTRCVHAPLVLPHPDTLHNPGLPIQHKVHRIGGIPLLDYHLHISDRFISHTWTTCPAHAAAYRVLAKPLVVEVLSKGPELRSACMSSCAARIGSWEIALICQSSRLGGTHICCIDGIKHRQLLEELHLRRYLPNTGEI
jgi:hypothetical protein